MTVLGYGLMAIGCLALLIGAIGLIRLPDFYTRTHAASMTDTGGAGLILLGLMLQSGGGIDTIKLALILIFIVFTSPTAGHALARAALSDGLKPLLKRRNSP